ncbi:MAG: hypothetical protein GY906_23285 [bacterium]|nr:hypothetical protein [bacterium]
MDHNLKWAWIAGLIEGEGCIRWRVWNNTGYGEIVVAMKDADVIERLHEWTGCGKLYWQRRKTGPSAKYDPLRRWACSRSEDVLSVLELIRPYLGQRRGERADLVITNLKKKLET